MTTTPATQAILPVTPKDREAAASLCERGMANKIRNGNADDHIAVQAFARHRDAEARRCAAIMQRITQAHSLPGDVGMREALSELWSIVHGCDLRLSVPMETIHKARAALAHPAQATPSALSGDAGEVQDWQKPYADAGHDIASVFNPMTTKCKRCGTPQIDLSEDLAYGPMRQCRALPSHKGAGE